MDVQSKKFLDIIAEHTQSNDDNPRGSFTSLLRGADERTGIIRGFVPEKTPKGTFEFVAHAFECSEEGADEDHYATDATEPVLLSIGESFRQALAFAGYTEIKVCLAITTFKVL